jgi:hypothetical protein
MKSVFATAALGLVMCGPCFGQNEGPEFLSWYDGWGTHTVWGAGKISGSYKNTQANCGGILIPVRAIYDSHETDGAPLSREQSSDYAREHNSSVLEVLNGLGVECDFLHGPVREA